ncbi:MAG: BACON domain-containing protein [Phocaeicola sp.]|nr:BACON domain-containing protein [Phocaeicola sp.]MDD7448795.1 BACON domain-containing protein [Prevotellaceae bacterium]MDY5939060.1 BACON domain-containing protein [Phocaeicola sp.]
MKEKILRALYLCLMVLTVFACSEENGVEPTELNLSEENLIFAKEASQKNVTITTNDDDWSFISSNENWLTGERAGNELHVKVKTNELGTERTATILVLAGDKRKSIIVKQSAADTFFNVSETKLKFTEQGGTQTIDVETNNDAWKMEIEGTNDWITLKTNPKKGIATIVIAENKGDDERKATIVATSGTSVQQIDIVQRGTFFFSLPLMAPTATENEVIKYEIKQNGSFYKGILGEIAPAMHFIPASSMFKNIIYTIEENAPYYTRAVYQFKDKKAFENPKLEEYILAEGFTKGDKLDSGDNTIVQYHKTTPGVKFRLSLISSTSNKVYAMMITPTIIQKDPQPTFSKFPYGYIKAVEENLNQETITKWETTTGEMQNPPLEVDADDEKIIVFTPKDKKNERYGSIYWMSKKEDDEEENDKCLSKAELFLDLQKGLFINGIYHMPSNEFLELSKKEGFEFLGVEEGKCMFVNRDRKLGLIMDVVSYKDILPEQSLSLHFLKIDPDEGTESLYVRMLLNSIRQVESGGKKQPSIFRHYQK